MGVMVSQFNGESTVCSAASSGWQQKEHTGPHNWLFVKGNHLSLWIPLGKGGYAKRDSMPYHHHGKVFTRMSTFLSLCHRFELTAHGLPWCYVNQLCNVVGRMSGNGDSLLSFLRWIIFCLVRRAKWCLSYSGLIKPYSDIIFGQHWLR